MVTPSSPSHSLLAGVATVTVARVLGLIEGMSQHGLEVTSEPLDEGVDILVIARLLLLLGDLGRILTANVKY